MENSILNRLLFDPAYLIFGLAGLVAILLIAVIVCIFKMRALFKKYDLFMRDKDGESMEDSFLKVYGDVEILKQEDKSNKDMIRAIQTILNRSYQKTSIVRYDAFQGMGGQFSFVMTLLDRNDSGVMLNCIHNRESCYLYIKAVVQGECDVDLSKEEKKSLEEAKNKH